MVYNNVRCTCLRHQWVPTAAQALQPPSRIQWPLATDSRRGSDELADPCLKGSTSIIENITWSNLSSHIKNGRFMINLLSILHIYIYLYLSISLSLSLSSLLSIYRDTYQKKYKCIKKNIQHASKKKYICIKKKYPGATVWDLTGFVLQT
jgi:hypothetical protein